MDLLMILLRIVHIFSGIFWAGGAIINVGILSPAVEAGGLDGAKFRQFLFSKTKFSKWMGITSTLTLLSGLVLYWILYQFRVSALDSPYVLVLTIGAFFGIISWVHGSLMIGRMAGMLGKIQNEIAAGGKPPSSEQVKVLQELGTKMNLHSQIGSVLIALAVLGMSIAQYVYF